MIKTLAKKRKFIAYGTGGAILLHWILMFLPYYNYGEGNWSSIQGYIWLDFSKMEKYWKTLIPGYSINNEFLVPFALFFIAIVAALFCFTMPREWFSHVICLLWSVLGLVGFPITKTLHYGNIFWVHIVIFALVAAVIICNWLLDAYAKKNLPPEEIKLF